MVAKDLIVAVDIGGTFTDAVMLVGRRGLISHKTMSTPDDPARGALTAIEGLLAEGGREAEDIAVVLHATTLVSNVLIERKGARTALLATAGFRDILDIGREKKYDIYDLQLEKPEPLIPREHRFEVAERIAADGSIVTPLTERSLQAVVRALGAAKFEAVAVCLLHSYMNPVHERALRAFLECRLKGVAVSLSSDVLPEMREYERTSTTAANAFVQPTVQSYLQRFADGLREQGVEAALFIMLSEGGIASPDVVRRFPVRICESGPAAGAIAAASIARRRRAKRILSFDMGGTTAKSCLIHDGTPLIATDFEVARMYRFKKGSGLPLKIPVVDLIEIGAGGGSIVRVDELGLLKVGPDSVGADPGPACYGLGGTLPTVTDADLVLGYLGADSFLGGRMPLDATKAREAIADHVAKPLGISVLEAALGIHGVVNENMSNASRVQAVERGHDPSGYVMVAFGGAGPVHAWGVARRLSVSTIIAPVGAGFGSAFGLLLAPRSYSVSRTFIGTLDRLNWRYIESIFAEMTKEANAVMHEADVDPSEVTIALSADIRYLGQRKELTVDLPDAWLRDGAADILRRAFEQRYRRIYHRIHADHPIETLCWRLAATGPRVLDPDRLVASRRRRARSVAPAGRRSILFAGWKKPRQCPVYRREFLRPGDRLEGPAVIEEKESTTVIGPGGVASIDSHSNLIVQLPQTG